jgi:hypothetical protein
MLLSEFVAELTSRVEREKETLASGAAKTYEEYARKVGQIAGLRAAVAVLYDMVVKLPKEERSI